MLIEMFQVIPDPKLSITEADIDLQLREALISTTAEIDLELDAALLKMELRAPPTAAGISHRLGFGGLGPKAAGNMG